MAGLDGAEGPTPPRRFAVLLGDPVAHSRSPALHNAAFQALGLDAVYLACRVPPAALPDAVAGLRALGALGANVTVPHKEAVLPLLDRLAPTAAAVGAVNTLVVEDDGTVRGENTDVEGFLEPLHPLADRLHGASALVLGAGGAARAAAYALLTTLEPTRLTIAARRPDQTQRLAAALAPYDAYDALRPIALAEAAPALRESALVVNATPVGMAPHDHETPWPDAADFHPGQIVYDLVYAPTETRLLREAAAEGATPLGGLAMLIGQAAAAFRLWTGREMPLDAVHAALSSL
ncbi:MAG: shikimate dehydrogenase [Rubricoccaceae bacterium]|nr:shikimate dehydrogenase [Rubricoccaceae bacterium]